MIYNSGDQNTSEKSRQAGSNVCLCVRDNGEEKTPHDTASSHINDITYNPDSVDDSAKGRPPSGKGQLNWRGRITHAINIGCHQNQTICYKLTCLFPIT